MGIADLVVMFPCFLRLFWKSDSLFLISMFLLFKTWRSLSKLLFKEIERVASFGNTSSRKKVKMDSEFPEVSKRGIEWPFICYFVERWDIITRKKERKKERKKTHLLAFKQWRKWTKGQLLTKCFFSFLKVPKGQHFFLEMGRCNFS